MSRRFVPTGNRMAAPPQLPNFLHKLSAILEDPQFTNVIRWNEEGDAFSITNPYTFSTTILPQYFKHNNINSFIRQLNLYGFRKIVPAGKFQESTDHLHFSHPNFLRDRPNLMFEIKRNAPAAANTKRAEPVRREDEPPFNPQKKTVLIPEEDLVFLIRELKDNILLWQEMAHLRNSQAKQQENVSKLVQFLVGVVQPAQRRQQNTSQRIVPLEEELGDAVPRANSSAAQMNFAENPNNRLALQCGGQGPFRVSGGLDCAVLNEIQEELSESGGTSGQFSVDAETALLEGLQLRQRAIAEGAPYLENGLLNGGEQALERTSNLRNELNFHYDPPTTLQLKRPFQRHVLSPSPSPSTSLCPKRPLYVRERAADPKTIQLSSPGSSSSHSYANHVVSTGNAQQADGQPDDNDAISLYLDNANQLVYEGMDDEEEDAWNGEFEDFGDEQQMVLMPVEGEMEHEQPQQHSLTSKRR